MISLSTLQPLKEIFPTTKNWRSINLCFDFQPVIDNSVHRDCHWVSRKYLGVQCNSIYFLFPNSSVFFLINLHKVIISLMATLGFWHKYTKTKTKIQEQYKSSPLVAARQRKLFAGRLSWKWIRICFSAVSQIPYHYNYYESAINFLPGQFQILPLILCQFKTILLEFITMSYFESTSYFPDCKIW